MTCKIFLLKKENSQGFHSQRGEHFIFLYVHITSSHGWLEGSLLERPVQILFKRNTWTISNTNHFHILSTLIWENQKAKVSLECNPCDDLRIDREVMSKVPSSNQRRVCTCMSQIKMILIKIYRVEPIPMSTFYMY